MIYCQIDSLLTKQSDVGFALFEDHAEFFSDNNFDNLHVH